jgi:hypothetical protein
MKAVVLIKSAAPNVIHVGVPENCVAAPIQIHNTAAFS